MTVWQFIVLIVCVYLLASVGPWLALQVLLWRRQREGSPVASLAERRASLETALRAQETSWPPTPRAGRYEPIDRQARGHLADLRRAVGDMAALWPALEGQTMAAGQAAAAPLAPLAVAALGAWRPMRAEWTLARTLRNAASLLEEGEEAVRDLQQLEHVVASIPQRMHAELRNHRAELERLSALLEAETDYGTADLDAKAGRLREIHHAVESALEALEQTQSEALPVAAAEIDARLDQIGNDLAALDRSIGEVAQARGAAQAALTRIGHGLQAAGVRWAELTAAGLSEPTIPQALAYLESERRRLELLMGGRTADAYHQVAAAATTIDEQFAALDAELDALAALAEESRQAMEGSVKALADAQERCDRLAAADPPLEPDVSREAVARASAQYRQAEGQRQLGTRAGLEAGLESARQARATLQEALACLEPLAEQAVAVQQLVAAITPEVLAAWVDRLEQARAGLQGYARHWLGETVTVAERAAAGLAGVVASLANLPGDAREPRTWRQSEVPGALAALAAARDALISAAEDVEALEGERERLDALAAALAAALSRIRGESLPALQRLRAAMLPEAQQRLGRIEAGLAAQAELYADPAQVDYDEAVEHWLPAFERQLAEIEEAHAEDVRACRRQVREVVAEVDRQWGRLARLSPYQRPGPEEDVEALAGDLDLWRADLDAHPDDPLALRDLLGQRLTALQVRIDAAQAQIAEGRRNLSALDRQYGRSIDAARLTRARLREAQHASSWPSIAWDTEAADEAWERALNHERESQAALTLTQAAHAMQQALAAARDAEGIYARIEGQCRAALRRLNDEQRGIEATIERMRRNAEDLAGRGQADEASAIEAALAAVAGHLQMSREATTVDDALRHLRDARSVLGRG